MALIIYRCKNCPYYKQIANRENGACTRSQPPGRAVEDKEKQPAWCPLPEEDPMST